MIYEHLDTICAPATTPGTGAITVVRVSGPKAIGLTDSLVRCRKGSLADAASHTIKYGDFVASDGELLDDVLVSIFRAPHSYTGEDSVEISCHASSYICKRVLEELCLRGCRMAGPGEFTRRAFANGRMDLAQAEAVADLIASSSSAAHRIALRQMRGGFSGELDSMRTELLEMAALMELELDFSEEEVEFADRERLCALVDRLSAHIGRLVDSFRLGNAIKNGIPVAIVGAPNSGKSTLLNALLGEERAIVSDVAGTTRDTIEETMTLGGNLFRFIDTAGIRETSEEIERLGIERTFRKLSEAAVVLGIVDSSSPSASSDAAAILSHVDLDSQELIMIWNKIDLTAADGLGFGMSDGLGLGMSDSLGPGMSDGLRSGMSDGLGPGMSDGLRSAADAGRQCMESTSASGCVQLPLSAASGAGLDALRAALCEISARRFSVDASETLVINLRHVEALRASLSALSRVRDGLVASIPTDLVAQDLREAMTHLGTITGAITTDDLLGEIFGKFCIGK